MLQEALGAQVSAPDRKQLRFGSKSEKGGLRERMRLHEYTERRALRTYD